MVVMHCVSCRGAHTINTMVLCPGIPLLSAAFIADYVRWLISLVIASTFALLAAGMTGAWLGGAGLQKPTGRVLIGG